MSHGRISTVPLAEFELTLPIDGRISVAASFKLIAPSFRREKTGRIIIWRASARRLVFRNQPFLCVHTRTLKRLNINKFILALLTPIHASMDSSTIERGGNGI